ncbi:MAG: type II toxin-antitoxin system VapC family toxin, partial [Acidobacteriota bacterium]|nr:type II toxin-antitoxin system VapC family toxin [Acidobacteriota bacterium]
MKLLLDTHIWLFSLIDPGRLSQRVVRALEAEDSELWLSSMSVWEALALAEKGLVELDVEPEEWIERALRCAPLIEAPVTHEIARESLRVELDHPDPADRLLVATARVHELTLVTADKRLAQGGGVPVLACAVQLSR